MIGKIRKLVAYLSFYVKYMEKKVDVLELIFCPSCSKLLNLNASALRKKFLAFDLIWIMLKASVCHVKI